MYTFRPVIGMYFNVHLTGCIITESLTTTSTYCEHIHYFNDFLVYILSKITE